MQCNDCSGCNFHAVACRVPYYFSNSKKPTLPVLIVLFSRCRKIILIKQALEVRASKNGRAFAELLDMDGKVSNGAEPHITRDVLTTFIVLGPKGLITIYKVPSCDHI